MEGVIVNYRMGRHHQNPRHVVIKVEGYSNKEEAKKLVGKGVKWVSPAGKELNGKVANFHGNSGAVRAIFEIGLPGQAMGKKVELS